MGEYTSTKQRMRRIGGAVAGGVQGKASLTTSMTGTNNDLRITAKHIGTSGNSITFRIATPTANSSLSVAVADRAITVTPAANASAVITSTAAQVRDAINNHGQASSIVYADLPSGENGTGVVTALGVTSLSGGSAHTSGR